MFRFRSKHDTQSHRDWQKLQTFRSAGIVTKLCLPIECMCTIFAPQTFSDLTSSFGARGLRKFRGNLSHHELLSINPLFIIVIARNLKYFYRMEPCINDINITVKLSKGVAPLGWQSLKISQFLYFWAGNPQIWTCHSEIWQSGGVVSNSALICQTWKSPLSESNSSSAAGKNWLVVCCY